MTYQLDHDQWQDEYNKALMKYLRERNDINGARQYADRLTTLRFGVQPEKIYKEGEKPSNILTVAGNIITAPIKAIKGGIEAMAVINALLKNGKTLIGSIGGVFTIIMTIPWDTIAAWFTAHPMGAFGSAIVLGIGWINRIYKLYKEIAGKV